MKPSEKQAYAESTPCSALLKGFVVRTGRERPLFARERGGRCAAARQIYSEAIS